MADLRLGFLASHEGTNVQAIIYACKDGRLDARPCVVISNNARARVLSRARREGVPWRHLSTRTHPDPAELDKAIRDTLQAHQVNLVVLAGYMKKLGPLTLDYYHARILNTHPALLPKFGGKGMYGRHVHEAVLAAGEKVTGVTIHLVDEEYDTGKILAQSEVPVVDGDTPDTLSERVRSRERELYVETLRRISSGEIEL